jgi:hypothetical protein
LFTVEEFSNCELNVHFTFSLLLILNAAHVSSINHVGISTDKALGRSIFSAGGSVPCLLHSAYKGSKERSQFVFLIIHILCHLEKFPFSIFWVISKMCHAYTISINITAIEIGS